MMDVNKMTKISLLAILIFIENVFCIYRNFTVLNKFWSQVAVARVVITLVINVGACVTLVITTYNIADDTVHQSLPYLYIFTIFTTVNSAIAVIIAIMRTNSFKVLVASIISVNEYCQGGDDYKTRIGNLRKGVVILIPFFIIGYFIGFLTNIYQWLNTFKDQSLFIICSGIIHSMLSFWREVRFQFEFLTFNVFIKAIIISLAHLNARLMSFLKSLDDLKDGMNELTCLEFRQDLERWTSAYTYLTLCSDGSKKCFGVQIAFSLFILVVYFVALSYSWVATIMSKAPGSAGMAIVLLASYALAMTSLFYTGQQVRNEAAGLQRTAARLYSAVLAISGSNISELVRMVKDLARQTTVQPIKIKVLSTTDVEMSFLLVLFSTALSYTIVLLQFSHVV